MVPTISDKAIDVVCWVTVSDVLDEEVVVDTFLAGVEQCDGMNVD